MNNRQVRYQEPDLKEKRLPSMLSLFDRSDNTESVAGRHDKLNNVAAALNPKKRLKKERTNTCHTDAHALSLISRYEDNSG